MNHKANLAKLQKEWYAKLKENGFHDIEDRKGGVGRGAPRITNQSPLQIEVIEQYYSMARNFLIDGKFDTDLDKTIWSYHSEGISARDISSTLKSSGVKKLTSYVKIWQRVKHYEKLMKEKYLAP